MMHAFLKKKKKAWVVLVAQDMRGSTIGLVPRNGADGIFGMTDLHRSEMHLFPQLCLHCDHLSRLLLTSNL